MKSKIIVLAFIACYQVTLAQRPTAFPMPFGTTPPLLGNAFNNNWVRPYYTAAAEGWRTYFEQLQQARNQLYQTLTSLQNTAQNSDLSPPVVEAPAHDVPQDVQVLQTVTRPQTQADVPKVRPQQQVTVTHTVTQAQPNSRQPQTVTHQVTSTRPLGAQVNSGVVPQVSSGVVPQVGTGVVPQVGSQIVPQVGTQIVPQVGSQLPSWVGK